jgi:AraC family transcriptional activator of pobA
VVKNPSSLDLVKRFAAAVEEHFLKDKSVSFYAALLNVHPNHLNAVIKAHTGLTAKESIQNRLMLEAKYLLHHTDLSIKEISHLIGFDDPNYFGVFFKRCEHRSPASYRSSFV